MRKGRHEVHSMLLFYVVRTENPYKRKQMMRRSIKQITFSPKRHDILWDGESRENKYGRPVFTVILAGSVRNSAWHSSDFVSRFMKSVYKNCKLEINVRFLFVMKLRPVWRNNLKGKMGHANTRVSMVNYHSFLNCL